MVMSAEADFSVLCQAARDTIGLRLEGYKSKQLERRLGFFCQRHGLKGVAELAHRLRSDATMRQNFADYLTINVTEFFRNPDRFQALQQRYLPELLKHRETLHVWSAGCSQGAEVYTVALLLESLAPGRHHQLLATDIDQASLAKAGTATYRSEELRQVPEALRQRFFQEGANGCTVAAKIRAKVQFRRHDLLRDPFPTDLDLILCRNVVIYFTEEAKAALYKRFFQSLRPGGLLFIGATESIFDARSIGLRYLEPCFYEKPVAATGGGSQPTKYLNV